MLVPPLPHFERIKMPETRETHPSYAQIQISRVSSSHGQSLYGSKLRHNGYISISISESEHIRHHNTDRYHPGSQIVGLIMTESQFAHMISNMNNGAGTPCTIERRFSHQAPDKSGRVPSPPYAVETNTVKNEFKELAKKVSSQLESALDKLDVLSSPGSKLTKAAVADLKASVEAAFREIRSNMPFVTTVFEETIDNVVASAKHDIEAYASDTTARIGVVSNPVVQLIADKTKEDNSGFH